MAPQMDLHFGMIELAGKVLSRVFGDEYWVRQQGPLRIGSYSGPEPDLAVVRGAPRDYIGKGHPANALLVVEIGVTTLSFDRGLKANLYARAGVADYWIVNLVDKVVEVYRSPVPDPAARLKHRYASVETFAPPSTVSPLAAPASAIPLAELLP